MTFVNFLGYQNTLFVLHNFFQVVSAATPQARSRAWTTPFNWEWPELQPGATAPATATAPAMVTGPPMAQRWRVTGKRLLMLLSLRHPKVFGRQKMPCHGAGQLQHLLTCFFKKVRFYANLCVIPQTYAFFRKSMRYFANLCDFKQGNLHERFVSALIALEKKKTV